MTLPEIVATIRDLGVALSVALALAIFLYKAVWPFVVKQVEDSKAARQEERQQFLDALARRDAEFTKLVDAMHALTAAVSNVERALKR